MQTIRLAAIIVALWAASAVVAHAQAAVPRVRVLSFTQLTDEVQSSVLEAFRQEGYVDGQNIRIEWRAANGQTDRARALAAELVGLKVDIIVAILTPAVQAAKDASSSIPIVMAPAGDPVATGFIASLARPGGNITGIAGFATELSGKRIEILQELLPGIKRIGLLTNRLAPPPRRPRDRVMGALVLRGRISRER